MKMDNFASKSYKIQFESGLSSYEKNHVNIINLKNKTIKKIKKGKINSFINIKKAIYIFLKYFILKLLFLPVFSLENSNKLSEITVKIRGAGGQIIFRKRGTHYLIKLLI